MLHHFLIVWLCVLCLGKIAGGLNYTPCGRYVVYPLGSFIVLKNLVTNKEAFLDGHTQDVSCIAMSNTGDRLASGQLQFTGVKVRQFYLNLDYHSHSDHFALFFI